MEKKKRYSAEERRAYWIGVGCGIGHYRKHGKVLKSLKGEVKESFKNGMDHGLLNHQRIVIEINKKGR